MVLLVQIVVIIK